MERQRRTRRGIGLALVLGLLAAACGGNGDDSGGGNATVSRGGVFRTATTDLSFTNGFDPTGEYSARGFNLYAPLLRTLVGFRRVGGAPGNELQPDLATELPQPADGGLTYTFRLRQGVKWAPPLDRDVTSKDVAYAFQRINAAPWSPSTASTTPGSSRAWTARPSRPRRRFPVSRLPTTRRSSSVLRSRPPTSCTG